MAQRTREQIIASIATLLADNTTGEITAADVRSLFTDTSDSSFNLSTDDLNDVPGLSEALTTLANAIAAKANSSHTHAISDVTLLQETITDLDTTKRDVADPIPVADIEGLVEMFLDPLDDQYVIADLEAATFTDDVATITDWAQGRFYYDSGLLYLAVADNTVVRFIKGSRNITVSTSAASGGNDGDIHFQVSA